MEKNIFGCLILEKNSNYVEELEVKYEIQLPPIFKAFVQTFEFGKFNQTPEHFIKHPNKELGYDGFDLTLEENIKIYFEQGEYYQKDQVLSFATSGIFGSGFCVGLNHENKDKILINFETNENKFEVIAPNILQFIAELKEIHWNSF
jgi:hypothetical protein